uniref:NADH dehydrogenase subunit 2 n=1 Tax=Hybos grossipes TaxID=1446182 RepID=UPI00207A8447|nr:NADH dehydrogenase subunit 2 [Hybos grossipes]URT60149.1 NADH dehydrogenase subunit 2 [Hybos grossipes]
MMKNSSKILFLLILMTGTMITVSANSWLSAWMGLEINLLAFIPLMNDNNNLMSTEASLKYFLTQALASSIFLFAIINLLLKNNLFNSLNEISMNLINLTILSTLLMKSGTAPFHFWFPGVMEGLSWMNSIILMTWQKIAPLMLISYLILYNFLYCIIILSLLIGSLGGLNQTSLRKIMAFSSINHLGWMISGMLFNENLWMIYFLFYSFLSITMIYFFNMFNMSHINQMFSMFFYSKKMKFSLFLNLLSLGGLPPFLGFLPKWFIIQFMIFNSQMFLLTIMTSLTLITLFFYLRLCYSAFLMNQFENNFITKMKYNNFQMNSYLLLSFLSIFGLVIISMMFSIL